jgi:hypothetical protein
MIETINIILNKMNNVCKLTQRNFIIELLCSILSIQGKVNFRNLSRFSKYEEKTFSRNYNKTFNFAEFNQQALTLVTTKETRLIAAFDPSFIPKAGKKTYGKDYFWNGSASRAEKGLEIGLLGVVDINYNTAYPISGQQTPPIAASRKDKNTPVTENSRIDAYLDHIKDHKMYLPSQVKIFAADSYFSKEKFVSGIVNLGLNMVGKLRIDAHLRFLFLGEQSGIGRPKQYDGAVDINNFEKLEFVENIKSDEGKNLKLYTAVVNSVSFKRDIRIAIFIDDKEDNKKKAKAIFFSTDIHQSASDIVVCYKARYQIEFIIRDGKGFAGLNDCQARSKKKLNLHFNASLAALNLTKIVDRMNQEKNTAKSSFSMASWKRRFYNEKLISSIFSMLGIDLTLIKLSSDFKNLVNYGVISRVT